MSRQGRYRCQGESFGGLVVVEICERFQAAGLSWRLRLLSLELPQRPPSFAASCSSLPLCPPDPAALA